MNMIFLFISLLAKEIKSSCPQPDTTFKLHDISKGNYSFDSGEYIYGCHITSQKITSNDCSLRIYACIFNKLSNGEGGGGAIYLSITDYKQTVISNSRIENCDFNNCYSRNNGGAIYLSSNTYVTEFTIIHCNFEKNYGMIDPKGNAIYIETARGVIQYCIFNCESRNAKSEGSAIYFAFNVDSTPSTYKVDVNNNEFVQNTENSKSSSLIYIENNKKFTLNFYDNSIQIENNTYGNFRLCKNTSSLSDHSSVCNFSSIYLNVEGIFGQDSVLRDLPFSTDAIIDNNTAEIPARPEEPGEPPLPDDKDPFYYLDENNCNKQIRCYRSVKTENQVYVFVMVTKFNEFQQPQENGGAIYIENCGLNCNSTEFTKCTSPNGCGGAIYYNNELLNFDNNVTFIENTFTGCKALYGGACYIKSDSELSEVFIKINKFYENEALSTDSSDLSKFGGSCIFLIAKYGILIKCSFKNSIGSGGSLKIFKDSKTVHSKSLKSDQNLNSILVDECKFENQEKGKDSIIYISRNDISHVNVRNCVFKGKLEKNSHYIDGLLMDENSPKIVVESCSFEYDLNVSVNLDLIKDEIKPSYTESQKVESHACEFLSGSVLVAAVITILLLVVKDKNNEENSKDDSLEV